MSKIPWGVQGWFKAEPLFADVVLNSRPGAKLAEVGAWRGQSTITMARYLKERGDTSIEFHVFDTWEGSDEQLHRDLISEIEARGKTLYEEFTDNLATYGVSDWVIPHVMASPAAASIFEDCSLDFVFLDGDHTYEGVCADIDAWLPKLKVGGVLAGDDWKAPGWETVQRAVEDKLGYLGIQSPCPYIWKVTKL